MHDITQLWGMCIIGKEEKKKKKKKKKYRNIHHQKT